ncbi:MAG: ribosomal protein L13e [Candidatus Bathyarchaeia archaeon]
MQKRNVQVIVKRKRKSRKGRGFSRDELMEVGLSFKEALKRGIPIDTRRRTKHKENIEILKS